MLPGHNEGNNRDRPVLLMSFSAGDNALGSGVKPVQIPFGCTPFYTSHISAFSAILGYNLSRIPNIYYLKSAGWRTQVMPAVCARAHLVFLVVCVPSLLFNLAG